MSRLNRKLNLNVLSEDETKEIRESHLNQSMGAMKSSISKVDVPSTIAVPPPAAPAATPRYEGGELAEVARDVYRANINPKKEKEDYEASGPDTHAQRVNRASIQRALMGLRNGGDEGKTAYVGPNGSGNVGKYSPSADSGSGNATNNADNFYALTTDMTFEEYEAYIQNKFSPAQEEEVEVLQEEEPLMEVKDYIRDLKERLLQLEDSSWQSIDKVMREVAKENYITPKQLHKEFKAAHGGQIPDEWLKENRDIEMAGFVPLQELARLNPAGVIYTVTYMFRGGTQRRKFLVPHTNPPTREEMEEYVRGFWPFARLIAYYPEPMDNQQNNNYMVAVPPITENYKFYTEADWITLSESEMEIYNTICEEEGEPLTAPEQQADGTYMILISDHDTGEQKMVRFGEAMQPQAGDSERKLAKAGAERQNAVAKLMQDKEMQKKMDDAIAKSVARDKAAGRGLGLPDMRLNLKREEVELEEEKDKKGKGSGSKDACYHKVKSRYSVWPSAYASGALVKCRQKGAANWGNSKKKD